VLAYLADEAGVMTQVSFQRRACPLLVALREKCLARGPMTHAVCEFYKWEPNAMLGARDRMMDDGVHGLDTLRWLCGGEVVEIHSHCRRLGTPDINWIGATLHFDTGAVGTLLHSWTSGRRVFRVEMHARGIAVDAEPEALGHVYADNDYAGETFDTREVAGGSEFFEFGGFKAKSREFIDSLLSGVEVTGSPFRDAVKTMEVAERILARAVLA
jgi:predicted dehydrogenase